MIAGLLDHWLWFALALVLLIVEMVGAGGYLLWLGMAAGLTGGLVFLLPDLAWQVQILVFSSSSVLCALGWWQYQQRCPKIAAEPLLNKRTEQYIGRVLVLADAVENGRGRAKVDDSVWSVSAAEDMPAGTRVKVLSLQADHLLFVEKLSEP
ncbi:MAG: NfeD family protein [Pseudomonadales bacterium]